MTQEWTTEKGTTEERTTQERTMEEDGTQEEFWEQWKREAEDPASPDWDNLENAFSLLEDASRTLAPHIERLRRLSPQRIEQLRSLEREEGGQQEEKRRKFLVCLFLTGGILTVFILMLLLREAETEFISPLTAVFGILAGAFLGFGLGLVSRR